MLLSKKLFIMVMVLPVIHPMAFAGTVSGRASTKNANYLHNLVVYVRKAKGDFQPKRYSPSVDQQDLKFIPKVLPVLVGTTVTFKNSDNVKHNVFSPEGTSYDLGIWGPGITRTHTFTKPGIYTQLCNIHNEMRAFILVLQNPYFTKVAGDGSFQITGIPPGEYELKVWHYNLKAKSQKIKVGINELTVNFDL